MVMAMDDAGIMGLEDFTAALEWQARHAEENGAPATARVIRALAGVRGNTSARIFTQSLEAELVSIAGIYRTFEHDWGAEFRNKPAQIYLEGDKLLIAALPQG